MKFSRSWLSKFIDLKIDTAQLSQQLTTAGLEVAEVKPVSGDFCDVIIGEILEVNKHPNADKLSVCKVNIGEQESLVIVCGASNVRPKLKVPVAIIGAQLQNNQIKKVKLRGVESCGMMCSSVELGLAEASSGPGLLELPDDAPIGMDLRQYLILDDEVIEIELTPNRGDCLSIVGISREIAAINRIKRVSPDIPKVLGQGPSFPVTINAKEACPHYSGRIIHGVNNNINTPIWIKERLRRSDIQSINPIVDIANYVMLELGQPLHVFDLAKLDSEINVRYATQGEEITLLGTLLGGNRIKLNDKTLVIADKNKCVAIAGVMGGIDSSVNKNTTDVFIESAFFAPEKIAGIARSYGLQTDASYRYERGVDYTLQLPALDLATSLLLEIVGGKPSEISEITAAENMPKRASIYLHRNSIEKILGVYIEDKDIFAILSHLEMQIEQVSDGFQVVAPSFRFDVSIEEDLVEEIARIYGYQNIPEQKIISELMPPLSNITNVTNTKKDRIYELMTDLGYNEVITYSFIDAKLQALFDPENTPLLLVNPISPELSSMRTSICPGLINAAKYNFDRKQERIRFFEIGLRFLSQGDCLQQIPTLAGIVSGDVYPEQWGIKQKGKVDFFDLKNDVEAILKSQHAEYLPIAHPALHPKRSAQICVANAPIGFIGEIHPKIRQELDLTGQVYLFEINFNSILVEQKNIFNEFSRFPKIQRDIALVVNKEIAWQNIRQKIVDISGELLHNIKLFDIYCGECIGLDKKSLGIRLIFQSVTRTLVDTEIEDLVSQIISVLKQTLDANLRG